MKTICKNIAFSESGECLLREKCICKANELWLEEEDETPSEEPNQDELWDKFFEELDSALDRDSQTGPYVKTYMEEKLRNKYSISRK